MKKRLITAIIMAAVLIPLVIIGGVYFEIALTIISCFSIRELLNAYETKEKLPLLIKIISIICTALIVFSSDILVVSILLSIILLLIPMIFMDKYNYETASFALGSTIFIGISFYIINIIRVSSIEELIYILSITILTDTFAYVGGKIFGKHKLIPKVSPNKTIEGSIIGSSMGLIIPSIYYLYMVNPGMNLLLILFITLILSITDQIGDLIFSSIKRKFKIKDFSNILPGHGGFLDRFDSLIIVSIVYTIIKILFI